MTVFDDYEPEDAWAPDDPIPEQIRNLRHRLALLVDSEDTWTPDELELELIAHILQMVRGSRLSTRDVLRADDMTTDIALVRSRL